MFTEEQEKALLTKVADESKKAVEEMFKGYATSKDIEDMQALLGKAPTVDDVNELKTAFEKISDNVKALLEGASKRKPVDQLMKSLENIENDMKEEYKRKTGKNTRIELKDFSLGGNFNPDWETFQDPTVKPGIARTPDTREQFNILNYVTVGNIETEYIKWREEDTETGTANFIDECVLKPIVSKTWKTNQSKVEKVAAFTTVCDEVLMYVQWAAREIRRFLNKVVYIAIQDAILNGDGIGDNLLGIIPQSTLFVAGAKAASVKYANYSDAIRACVSQINCLGFRATHVLVNCDDIFVLDSTKDENANYISRRLGGVTLVECPFIPAGEFLVGDMTLSNVDWKQGITVDMGYNGTDFRENAISMRGEAFLAHYIASNQLPAFIYETFANVISLIDKP